MDFTHEPNSVSPTSSAFHTKQNLCIFNYKPYLKNLFLTSTQPNNPCNTQKLRDNLSRKRRCKERFMCRGRQIIFSASKGDKRNFDMFWQTINSVNTIERDKNCFLGFLESYLKVRILWTVVFNLI